MLKLKKFRGIETSSEQDIIFEVFILGIVFISVKMSNDYQMSKGDIIFNIHSRKVDVILYGDLDWIEQVNTSLKQNKK